MNTNSTNYNDAVLNLIYYKIGNLNINDQNLISYLNTLNFNKETIIQILMAQNRQNIIDILRKNYPNYSHSILVTVLKFKKLSAYYKFRSDYEINSVSQIYMLAQKKSLFY